MALSVSACEASQRDVGGTKAGQERAADPRAAASNSGKNVTDEQAINQRFSSLDEYLAFLKRTQAPVDRPWYKQVRPGIYELQTGNLRVLGTGGEEPQVKQTFTRDELERKFGFSK
jgi:hypothetical protein